MTIPDWMPTLAAGDQAEGSGQACVMQYVSVIAGDRWTDQPECTNYYIAGLAQYVNDELRDEDRHLLVPLIGRLIEAGESGRMLDAQIMEEVEQHVGWQPDPTLPCTLWMYATKRIWEYKANWIGPQPIVDVLEFALATHERLTGKTAAPPMSEDALASAKRLIETGAK